MMTPYYTSGDGKIEFILIHDDCFRVLNEITAKYEMIFADPPYFLSNGGISVQNGRMVCVDKGEWDKGGDAEYVYNFNKQWLSLCREKLVDNGTIWVSGTYHNIFAVAKCLTELNYKILNVITWQKTDSPPNLSHRYFNFTTEYIIWARKLSKKTHVFNYEAMRHINGGQQMGDVWKIPAVGKWEKTCGKHPTQKPLHLLYRIIVACTKEGDTILDPFAGSCTTGIAANLLGRNFVGIDKEQNYLDLGIRRRQEIEDEQKANKLIKRMRENPIDVMVLVNHTRKDLYRKMVEKGICYLRLGDSKGSITMTPNFSRLKYVLLHTNGENCQLFPLLKKDNFQIWKKETLIEYGFPAKNADYYIVIKFINKPVEISTLPQVKQKLYTFCPKLCLLSDFIGQN